VTYLGSLEITNSLETLTVLFAGTIANAEAKVREPAHVEVQELEGVPLAANAAPAPVKGTASVELIGAAESAATAEREALGAWAGNKAGRGLCVAP
jgi:hypothetical protein